MGGVPGDQCIHKDWGGGNEPKPYCVVFLAENVYSVGSYVTGSREQGCSDTCLWRRIWMAMRKAYSSLSLSKRPRQIAGVNRAPSPKPRQMDNILGTEEGLHSSSRHAE